MSWTPERIERLRTLWAEGHSCSIIANRLGGGATRNAVIGKASRLRLPARATILRAKSTQTLSKHQPLVWHRHKAKPAKPFYFGQNPATPTVKLPTLPLPMPTADDKARVSAKAVKDNECRWPVGDTHDLAMRLDDPIHCGLPKMPGSSYCAGHHARATVPLKPRQRPDLPAESNVVHMPKREPVAA